MTADPDVVSISIPVAVAEQWVKYGDGAEKLIRACREALAARKPKATVRQTVIGGGWAVYVGEKCEVGFSETFPNAEQEARRLCAIVNGEQPEPVAWVTKDGRALHHATSGCLHTSCTPLFATPPAPSGEQAYYDQQAVGGYVDGLKSALNDAQAEVERWRKRENNSTHERVMWRHMQGDHTDAEHPFQYCALCEMEHPTNGRLAQVQARYDELAGAAEKAAGWLETEGRNQENAGPHKLASEAAAQPYYGAAHALRAVLDRHKGENE